MPGEDDIRFFKELFSQVFYLVKQGDRRVIEAVITECENINWFYNWIIYSIKMAELCANAVQMDSKSICESAITNLELLLQDTEVFKGEPRTCDLYFLQNELTKSYERAVELVIKNGTVEDFEKALGILERLDDETGTSFDHSMGGPLTDAEFLKLISRFLTIDNYEIVKPYLLRTQEKIEKNEVYDCIAAAKLRFVTFLIFLYESKPLYQPYIWLWLLLLSASSLILIPHMHLLNLLDANTSLQHFDLY